MTAMMAFWVAVVSLVFGAVCSTLHLSLRGLSRSRIDQLAERGSDGLRVRATKILVDRTGHAASIALPRVLANILAALETMRSGDVLEALLCREPMFLLPELAKRGHAWRGGFEPDGTTYKILVRVGEGQEPAA